MDLEQSKWRCKELTKEAHAGWIGISNQKAIETVLNELEKKDRQILKIKEFLEREQLELHDYDDSHDLSCEGKGRMYLVDELLEEHFTKKVEGK